jgi:hypothetical protein
MNAHTGSPSLSALDALGQRLLPGQARRVGRGAGTLTVLSGRVWLTGQGDGDDRVLGAGERLQLAAADAVVIETLDRDHAASVAWHPRATLLAQLRLREFFGAAFAALARKAASRASRAHGRISGADSMACSGALK